MELLARERTLLELGQAKIDSDCPARVIERLDRDPERVLPIAIAVRRIPARESVESLIHGVASVAAAAAALFERGDRRL